MCRKIPFIPKFVECFYHEKFWILSNAISVSIKTIYVGLCFIKYGTVDPHYSQLCICEFTNLLKFITLKLISVALLRSFVDMCKWMKNLSHPIHMVPAEAEHDDALPSCFSLIEK